MFPKPKQKGGKARSWALCTVRLVIIAVGVVSVGQVLAAADVGIDDDEVKTTHARPDAASPDTADAFLFLQPGTGGSVPAPGNGGQVGVGDRFVLDLLVNSGSNIDVSEQSTYLTF